MRITQLGPTMLVGDIEELCAENADSFRAALRAHLTPEVKSIEVDLSQTRFIDSSGLSALVGMHQAASRMPGPVRLRLVDPAPHVRQILELTRLHRVLDVADRPATPAST